MGVNMEMHDCEPAVTRPQHLNVSYGPSWSPVDGQITRHFGLLKLSAARSLPPPPSFLIRAQWMTHVLLTMRGTYFNYSPFFLICLSLHRLIAVVNHSLTPISLCTFVKYSFILILLHMLSLYKLKLYS